LRVAGLLFAMYLLAMLLWFTSALVFVAFLGVLFGLAVSTGVDVLARYRVPRAVGAVTIVLGFFLILAAVGVSNMPTIREQSAELKTKIPESVDRIEQWLHARGIVLIDTPADSSGRATGSEALRERLGQQLGNAARYVFPFLSQTLTIVGGLLLVVFMAIYIGAEPDLYRRGAMLLFPRRVRSQAGDVLTAIATVLRKWLVTQLIAMAVIGTASTIALLILGVKAPFALGLLAGLFEFIPTIGPVLSAVPAIAMGFLDSPEKALTVGLVYWGIQFLENNLLIPLLMKDGVNVPPVLTILAQALLTVLFGFLGLMVAVPLVATAMVIIRMLYVEPDPVPMTTAVPPVPGLAAGA
jgi:predicted PurR-regulated permease PerM